MAELVANNSETTVGRILLQPGINIVGRAEGNHHVIPHASVSSRHCEIIVHDSTIVVRDLGSTNGTFVDDQPFQQGEIAHGQRLKLGSVEFVVDAPEVVAAPRTGPMRVAVPRAPATSGEPPVAGLTAADAIAAITPILDEEPNFYRQIPGTFAYPFKKSGIILLIIGSIVFVVLDFLSSFPVGFFAAVFALGIKVIATGYLFAYMQKIIVHSVQGEDEMPDFPDVSDMWSDIVQPFLLFAGTVFVSLLPTVIVLYLMAKGDLSWVALIPALAFSAFYMPMALLAVAVTDNFLALSPHVVLPSIVRVFLPYLVTFLLLAILVALRIAGGEAAGMVPVQQVPLKLTVTLVMGFISLYLLTVEMRLLGLLFRAYRSNLGWV